MKHITGIVIGTGSGLAGQIFVGGLRVLVRSGTWAGVAEL